MKQTIIVALSILVIIFSAFLIAQTVVKDLKKPSQTLTNETTNISNSSKQENQQTESPKEDYVLKEKYSVPILMYHYIRDYNDSQDQIGTNLSVSPQKFEQQLKYLSDKGYKSISPSQLLSKKIPDKSIIITFDDGYNDAYTNAYPILKKYNMIGVFYIITNKIGRSEYISLDQIKEIVSHGMIIGSHTLSHPNLTTRTEAKLTSELSESKDFLEKNLNMKIEDFCYPSGKYNFQTIEELKKLGYTNAVTTKSGIATENSNSYELPRLRIQSDTNLEKLINSYL